MGHVNAITPAGGAWVRSGTHVVHHSLHHHTHAHIMIALSTGKWALGRWRRMASGVAFPTVNLHIRPSIVIIISIKSSAFINDSCHWSAGIMIPALIVRITYVNTTLLVGLPIVIDELRVKTLSCNECHRRSENVTRSDRCRPNWA